jgi:hypothetical protein
MMRAAELPNTPMIFLLPVLSLLRRLMHKRA